MHVEIYHGFDQVKFIVYISWYTLQYTITLIISAGINQSQF